MLVSALAWTILLLSGTGIKASPQNQFSITDKYNKLIRPPKLGEKFQIWASVNLRNIIGLSQSDQMISIEVSINLFWYDTRIIVNKDLLHGVDAHGSYLTITSMEDRDKLWTPDLFIDKVRKMRGPDKVKYSQAPISLRLYKDNLVRYSSRMNMDLGCKMQFGYFPFDNQTCSIRILSYSMDAKDLQLEWLGEEESYFGDKNTKLPDFEYTVELHKDPLEYSYFDKITRQSISVRIVLKRDWDQFVVFYYIPTIVFFFFGWSLNFILRHHPKSMLKIIFTLIVIKVGMMREIPEVNYLTFFNVWSQFCIMPIFFMIWQWVTAKAFINMDMKHQAEVMEKVAMFIVPVIYAACMVVYWILVLSKESS